MGHCDAEQPKLFAVHQHLGLLRESLGIWWPRLIVGFFFFGFPALLTPNAGGGGKGSRSSPGKKLKLIIYIKLFTKLSVLSSHNSHEDYINDCLMYRTQSSLTV